MTLITHCPFCHIAFHVTATQLKVANGLVRCGACLTVFDATLHQRTALADTTEQPSTPDPSTAPEDTIPLPLDGHPELDDSPVIESLDIDGSNIENPGIEYADIETLDVDSTCIESSDTSSIPPASITPDSLLDTNADIETAVEVDTDADPAIDGVAASSSDDPEHLIETDTDIKHSTSYTDIGAKQDTEITDTIGSQEPKPKPGLVYTEALESDSDPSDFADAADTPDNPDRVDDSLAASIEESGNIEAPETEHLEELFRETDKSDLVVSGQLVDHSPFPAKRPARQPVNPWLTAASVLVFLLLPLQYIYFYSDQLSLDLKHRRWLEPLCEALLCPISPLVSLSEIKSDHLLVYSHPSTDGALLVEAVLENRANFAQPFPNLLLYFDNLQGQRIAQRRFTPAEYLHGELDGSKTFPRNRPVRIRLAIIDPGPDAASYSLLVTN